MSQNFRHSLKYLTFIFLHIIALTLDNASSNDVLIVALSKLLIEKFEIQFVPGNSQIRCLNHILNLVVQQILASLKEAHDPEAFDYYDRSLPIHYSPEEDEDQLELEREDDPEELIEEADEEEKSFDQLLMADAANLSPLQKVTHNISVY